MSQSLHFQTVVNMLHCVKYVHEYQGITDYAFVIKHNEDNAFIVRLKTTQSQH
jgi:hypothetical protein